MCETNARTDFEIIGLYIKEKT